MSSTLGHPLRVGTRASSLALAQARLVVAELARQGIACETVTITTAGDRRAPDTAWGEGAFVGALEDALLAGHVDLAVHSAKDVPTDEHPRLRIGAYMRRGDPRDALVFRAGSSRVALDDLPSGTVIGTDSPRRRAFLLARRHDLDIRPLHGNVDTRLRRLDEGEADVLVLAVAGLERLGRADRIGAILPAEIVPPAPGQGALGVQARAHDLALEAVALIDDPATRVAVEAERALLAATGGGCRAPVGALATVRDDRIAIICGSAALDGSAATIERGETHVREAESLARRMAARIVRNRATLSGAPRVLVTRPEPDSLRLGARLAELGLAPVIVPAIAIEPLSTDDNVAAALRSLKEYDWAIVTSPNAARAVADAAARHSTDLRRVRWAAVGRTTARALAAADTVGEIWLPTQSNATSLGTELPIQPAARIVWFRGSLADDGLIAQLRGRGAAVLEVVAYRTTEAPRASATALAEALASGRLDGVIFASPSAIRGLLSLAESVSHLQAVRALPAICVGQRTAAAARDAGFMVVGEALTQDAATLAEVAAERLKGVPA